MLKGNTTTTGAVAALTLSACIIGCGVPTRTRPVPEGIWALEAAATWPVIDFNTLPLPIPHVTAGAAYGLAPRWDLNAHVHLASIAVGVAGLDLGATYLALEQESAVPAVTVVGRVYGFWDELNGAHPYVEAAVAASRLLQDRWVVFGTVNLLSPILEPRLLFSPAAGVGIEGRRWSWQLEVRYDAPYFDIRDALIGYYDPEIRFPAGTLGATYRFM